MPLNSEIHLFDEEEYTLNNEDKFELKVMIKDGRLIKSKERVQHHGEVFTPKLMVEKMLSEPTISRKIKRFTCDFLRTKCYAKNG